MYGEGAKCRPGRAACQCCFDEVPCVQVSVNQRYRALDQLRRHGEPDGYDNITFGSVTPGVPEPSTYAMLALGLLVGVGFVSRRRKAA